MFVSIHGLVSYPPSNPNRDDLGRPKSAVFGGTNRQRISSQSLKRQWRVNPASALVKLDAAMTTRTRHLPENVKNQLLAAGMDDKAAMEAAQAISGQFGKVEKPKGKDADKALTTSEVVVIGPEEDDAIAALCATLVAEKRQPTEKELESLELPTTALDTALHGRMRASKKSVNVDAACQVAHAITTNTVKTEADYWTAVDDLNLADDSGAGGIGEREFGSGVFYIYACVDVEGLTKNLGGDRKLAADATAALAECVATLGPTGHQSSFANRVKASYLLAEIGDDQPFTYADAFEVPVVGRDTGITVESIARLTDHAEKVAAIYGRNLQSVSFNLPSGEGTLASVKSAIHAAVLAGGS